MKALDNPKHIHAFIEWQVWTQLTCYILYDLF
jgi:hypothetical protein